MVYFDGLQVGQSWLRLIAKRILLVELTDCINEDNIYDNKTSMQNPNAVFHDLSCLLQSMHLEHKTFHAKYFDFCV